MSNNLFTLIWGTEFWQTLHNISFGYPDNPTNDDKNNYMNFFKLVQFVLPCCLCKEHYTDMINNSVLKIDIKYFENQKTLSKWIYDLHEYVNTKAGVISGVTYEMLQQKYLTYRTENDLNKQELITAFNNYYNDEAKQINYETSLLFAEEGLKYYPDYLDNIEKYKNITDKSSKEWIERNKLCNKFIKYMRINGVCSLGIVNKYELYLMMHLSTSLNLYELNNLISLK